ncbi:MAG: GWxTD domain-containing protein [Calditrichaeota bacterium]|nr:GWxTD domain-containing protein [Calditrichota bacterium]
MKILKMNSTRYRVLIAGIAVLLVFGATGVFAASPVIDYCQFKGEAGFYYLELYIDFPREAITFKATPDGWYGALVFKVEVKREGMETAIDKWIIEDICDNPEEITSIQRMVDVRVYNLTPTYYTFDVSVKDSISGAYSSEVSDIEIYEYSEQRVSLSGIELASHHIFGELAPKFNRGGYSLVPTPRKIIGEEKPYFFYYFEVYPPTRSLSGVDLEDKLSPYTISRYVLNGAQDTLIVLPVITRNAGITGFSETDTVFIEDLAGGSYDLLINVRDSDNFSFGVQKRFFVHQKELVAGKFDMPIDSLAVEEELYEIGFMMSAGQRKVINKKTLREKAFFLEEFWKLYDDDTTTVEVPLRLTYRERVATADERWQTSRRKGHQTDRGRVHVLFGECDSYDNFPLQPDTKPYQIWIYEYVDGGVEFVFVDRSGLGEYELVHSTRKGEINNQDWYELYVQRSHVESRR